MSLQNKQKGLFVFVVIMVIGLAVLLGIRAF